MSSPYAETFQSAEPPRRAFGVKPSLPRPSSAASISTTPTPPRPAHNGASSQLSTPTLPGGRTRTLSANGSPFGEAADKASAWLSTWAPRGEGRSREFLSNTLNGVVTVAGTVGSGIGSTVNNIGDTLASQRGERRMNSFSGMTRQESSEGSISPESPSATVMPLVFSVSPPTSTHTASTPQIFTSGFVGRKIPQPSNLARLGNAPTAPLISPPLVSGNNALRPSMSHPASSNPVPAAIGSPSPLSRSSSATLNPTQPTQRHGPSHLNPNARTVSYSSSPVLGHNRTTSFGVISSGRSPEVSRSSSQATAGPSRTPGMPYKVGFQPAGVRGDRTAEFVDDRKRFGEEREREEGRLGRRWAKLVDLHFNPTTQTPTTGPPGLPRAYSSSYSLSSQGDKRSFSLAINGTSVVWKPREMWKSVKGVAGPVINPGEEEAKKRAAEQIIVKWEDDGEVKKCQICQSPFNLSNRKHHCRLCGRIICSLAPTPPALLAVQTQLFAPASPSGPSSLQTALPPGTRKEKCSLLLVADWKTGRGEEVEEGFVGWMKVNDEERGGPPGVVMDQQAARREKGKSRLSNASQTVRPSANGHAKNGDGPSQQVKEIQVKGMRVCRECWMTVSRKQKIQDRQRVTGFAKLYTALRTLQAEIEDFVTEFEDAIDSLTSAEQPVDPDAETLAMHKHLLTLLEQYEHLSQRISSVACDERSSQAQVQNAVARSAALFLGKEMAKLQALPRLQKRAAEAKRKAMVVLKTTLAEQLKLEGVREEQAENVAVVLQPLLEQEAQLEVMIADANAQRKYEDGRALAEALNDIRMEIGRVAQKAIA